jgi:phosphate/sulfate permease
MRSLARTAPNFFSIPFGIAGLAVVWQLMATYYGLPVSVSDALFAVSAVLWIMLVVGAAARVLAHPRAPALPFAVQQRFSRLGSQVYAHLRPE